MTMQPVMIELRVPMTVDQSGVLEMAGRQLDVPGFTLDLKYPPVPVTPREDIAADLARSGERVVLIRGLIDENHEAELRRRPGIVGVWSEGRIEPFGPFTF